MYILSSEPGCDQSEEKLKDNQTTAYCLVDW